MTCIVAVVEKDTVYMGGDSAASCGTLLLTVQGGKLVQRGPYLIGSCGAFRLIQLLRTAFTPPDPPADLTNPNTLATFMSGSFVDALRTFLKEAGFARVVNGQEAGGHHEEILVAVAGRLFLIYSDYSVIEPSEPWAAIGSGDMVALGSLHSTRFQGPQERVFRALEAASCYTDNVRQPFVNLVLPAPPELPDEDEVAA